MNIERLHTIIRGGAWLLVVAAASLTLGACDVTGPDTAPWQQTSSFSWPVGLGKRSLYFRNELSMDSGQVKTDIYVFDMDAQVTSERTFSGQPMYKLDQQQRSTNYYFLPLKDTLVIFDQVPATLALTAPIEKGHEWDCAFGNDGQATWRATIVERYSYRNVEGKIYKNVIEVQYKPTADAGHGLDNGNSWVRFFAEGIGPVQTIKLLNTPSTDPQVPAKSVPVERTILIDPPAAD